mmetsp:Transcript_47908/g.154566  ORF Transcript_47908/g.154566 Transcript_47908/m.154566 type:complete len:285 (-) Transcript_47908:106-960(-)
MRSQTQSMCSNNCTCAPHLDCLTLSWPGPRPRATPLEDIGVPLPPRACKSNALPSFTDPRGTGLNNLWANHHLRALPFLSKLTLLAFAAALATPRSDASCAKPDRHELSINQGCCLVASSCVKDSKLSGCTRKVRPSSMMTWYLPDSIENAWIFTNLPLFSEKNANPVNFARVPFVRRGEARHKLVRGRTTRSVFGSFAETATAALFTADRANGAARRARIVGKSFERDKRRTSASAAAAAAPALTALPALSTNARRRRSSSAEGGSGGAALGDCGRMDGGVAL